MDPNATLERIRAARADGNLDECQDAILDLLEWIRGGGFAPTPTDSQLLSILSMALLYVEHRDKGGAS